MEVKGSRMRPARVLSLLFGLSIVTILSGCLSVETVHFAKDEHENFGGQMVGPAPCYYLLLPLTVPVDIASFPLQIPFWGNFMDAQGK